LTKKLSRGESPLAIPPYDIAIVRAIQDCIAGEATPDQQQRAMKWIIEQAGGMYEQHMYSTDRETTFSLGRQFVAQQIVKLSILDRTKMLERSKT